MSGETFYDRLGLPRDATLEEIRHAYRDLAQRLHPDKNLKPGETELFIGVQEAYDVLSDNHQKDTYDKSLPPDRKIIRPISTSITYSRNALTNLPEPQLIYAFLEFKVQADEDSLTKPPLNISLALDCSTSMHGIRLDTVKLTAIELIRQLKPDDILSVIRFSDKAQVIIPASSHFNHKEIETQIQLLTAGGGTEIFQGLDAAFSEVIRLRNKNHVNHIILITDGRTYGDETDCLRLVDRAAVHGIGISVLGIVGKWNDSFLDIIASRTGGSSKFISHTDDLKHLLLDKITKLGKSYAEHITLTFQPAPEVELKYAFRLQPESSPLVTDSPLVMGSVSRDATLNILLEFLVRDIPTQASRLDIAKGHLSYDVPARENKRFFSERLELWRPVGKEDDSYSPPLSIIHAMSRLTLYRMQDRARLELQDGKINEASQRLQNLATHLLARGHNNLARSVLSEVVHIQQTRAFSEEGEKRIKYGTRALLLPPGAEV
jgi:Ca-activated chloride channel family protein